MWAVDQCGGGCGGGMGEAAVALLASGEKRLDRARARAS